MYFKGSYSPALYAVFLHRFGIRESAGTFPGTEMISAEGLKRKAWKKSREVLTYLIAHENDMSTSHANTGTHRMWRLVCHLWKEA